MQETKLPITEQKHWQRAQQTQVSKSVATKYKEKAFKRKVQGAAQACQEQGIAFLPIAMETLGGFHKVAAEQVKRIGVAVARHQGVLETVAVKQLFQRLSLTLMRGNASLVMTRRPDSDLAPAEVDGII